MKALIIILFAGLVSSTSFSQSKWAVKTFKKMFSKVTDVKWEQESKYMYKVNFKDKNKEHKEHIARISADGYWMDTRTEINQSLLTKSIIENVEKEFQEYKIKQTFDLETYDNGKLYIVVLAKDNETLEVQFKLTGEIFKRGN
jgi:hypothetical protein